MCIPVCVTKVQPIMSSNSNNIDIVNTQVKIVVFFMKRIRLSLKKWLFSKKNAKNGVLSYMTQNLWIKGQDQKIGAGSITPWTKFE